MKKLILLFLLFSSFAYSQVDTANWSFLPNQTNGKFTALISRELYYGISGGQYKQMSLSATSYDSTVFQLIPNQLDGKYTMIENIATYYGKDSGTVQIPVVFDIGSANISFDTSLFVKRSAFSQQITATGGDAGITSDAGAVNLTSFTTISVYANGSMGFNSDTDDIIFTAGGNINYIASGGITFNGASYRYTDIPVYASNAAALSGGLIPGMLYSTSTGEVRIVYTP